MGGFQAVRKIGVGDCRASPSRIPGRALCCSQLLPTLVALSIRWISPAAKVVDHVRKDPVQRRAFEDNDWTSVTPQASSPFHSVLRSKRKSRICQDAMSLPLPPPRATALPEKKAGSDSNRRQAGELSNGSRGDVILDDHKLSAFFLNVLCFKFKIKMKREGYRDPQTREFVPATEVSIKSLCSV